MTETPDSSRTPQRWAVCADRRGAVADSIRAYLASQGAANETWYLPKDAEELDASMRAGEFDAVVFASAAEFLHTVFDGDLHPVDWPHRTASLHFATGESSVDDRAQPSALLAVSAAYDAWRRKQRRRRIIAGLVLSGAALICAFGLVLISMYAPHRSP